MNIVNRADLVNLIVPSNSNTVKLKLEAIEIPLAAAEAAKRLRRAAA